MNDDTSDTQFVSLPASPAPAPSPSPSPSPQQSMLRAFVHPMLIVGVLGGLAWGGHHSGWKLPKFSALTGGEQSANDDWCKDHAVPESQCVECNRKLAPWIKHYGWCEKHGVHNCPLEHPDAAQLAEVPIITQADFDRAARALAFKAWPTNNEDCLKVHRVLQIASQEAFNKMEVRSFKIDDKPKLLHETVTASGELQFMPKSVAAASSSVAGRVWQVTPKGKLGAHVQKGDVLAIIDAVEVGKARAELLQAFAQLDSRKQFLDNANASQSVVPATRLLELQAQYDESLIRFKAAEQALINLGLPVDESRIKGMSPAKLADELPLLGLPADVATIQVNGKLTANLVPIRAPRDGIVTEVRINEGETVETSKSLFVVADTGKLWLLLNVRQEDARYLKVREAHAEEPKVIEGSTVLFKAPDNSTEFRGTIVWKSSMADEKTRAIQFAAEVPNDQRLLAANSFVTARIVIREEKNAVVIPSEAIHWEGDCNVVFVFDKYWSNADSPRLFHIRSVRPGVKVGSNTEIIAGLFPGETVATTNSTALRAELLKNNLGAG